MCMMKDVSNPKSDTISFPSLCGLHLQSYWIHMHKVMVYLCADSHAISMCMLSSGISCWPYSQKSWRNSMHPLPLFFTIQYSKAWIFHVGGERALHPLSVTFSVLIRPLTREIHFTPGTQSRNNIRTGGQNTDADLPTTWDKERGFVHSFRCWLGTSFFCAVRSWSVSPRGGVIHRMSARPDLGPAFNPSCAEEVKLAGAFGDTTGQL